MATVKLSVDDPEFVEKIIYEVKSQGHFDLFRKECLADVDTQPAFQNLHSRVEDSVQKFLNRQVWTPETNKNKLREEMRYNIIRAGYLESGVSRIVDQVMEQKVNSIQLKVEEILYKYVEMEKPIKKEKQPNGNLEIDTDLLPTDLEQVSPDSDKKSSLSDGLNADDEVKDEQIEEEVIEDEDFESPAFEPVEPITADKNDNSNLSAISGLTSQDSIENKSEQEQPMQQDTQLSQISSMQDISQETPESMPPPPGDEMPPEPMEEPPEKSQFDLNKDSIEFTGTERKSITLDDSTNSGEAEKEKEKVLQPQDVPSNTMEIDNLYENDTTDSSEMRMEIDLKMDDTTAESSKIEESSQDSSISKEKEKDKHRHHSHHKSSSSRDKHKSSTSHKSSSRHHHSSSSKSRHDKSRNVKSSSSSGHKKSSGDKEKSASSRKDDKEKDRKSSSSKHHKDDHHQEKSSTRRRKSTDHDSNEGKDGQPKTSPPEPPTLSVEQKPDENTQQKNIQDNKPVVVDSMLTENTEMSIDSKSPKKEKASILVKYDYLKSAPKSSTSNEIEDGFCGFSEDETQRGSLAKDPKKIPENPWFACLRKTAVKSTGKVEQKKSDAPRGKAKQKSKSPDSLSSLTNGSDEVTPEMRAQAISQQQRYTSEDLYKPRFDFGNRSRRRGQITEETASTDAIDSTQ